MEGSLQVSTYGPDAVPGRRNLLSIALAATAASDAAYRGALGDDADALDAIPVDPVWANGFTFLADSCDALDPIGIECFGTIEKDVVENPDLVSVAPFLTTGTDQCSTLDNGRDRAGRAKRNLLATESWQIEREFFDGAATKSVDASGPWPNPFLTDGVTATNVTGGGAALAATRALATMERALMDCLHGQRSVIHATPDLVTLWNAGGALHLEGNTILTVCDSIVVPGSGYSGNAPDGTDHAAGESWCYGTGLVYLRQGNIFDPAEMEPASRVDRGTNLTTWRVERENAIYYAPCCVLAVKSSLTT